MNTTQNDLDYWGLDYPPLTAYQVSHELSMPGMPAERVTSRMLCAVLQSWLYGKAIEHFEPEAVALGSSRGYETPASKTLLRWSVVASDVLGARFAPCAMSRTASL